MKEENEARTVKKSKAETQRLGIYQEESIVVKRPKEIAFRLSKGGLNLNG